MEVRKGDDQGSNPARDDAAGGLWQDFADEHERRTGRKPVPTPKKLRILGHFADALRGVNERTRRRRREDE